MEPNGIIIPSRFSGVRRSSILFTSDDFAEDDDLPYDLLDDDNRGFHDIRIDDSMYQCRDDNGHSNKRVEDKTSVIEDKKRTRGRTHRRNQSDLISNYKVQNTRQSSEFCDTLEVKRIRDNKLFVIKTIPKKRLAVGKASSRFAVSVEYFADASHSLSNDISGNKLHRVLIPRRVFEDSVAVYFVFDYYETIQTEATSSMEMKQLYLEAEKFIGGLGYRVPDAKTTEIVKQSGQACFFFEIGTVQKVEKEPLVNANDASSLKRESQRTAYNQKSHGLGPLGTTFADRVLQHYWIDLSNIPYVSASTSQCRVEACDGRVDLYFYNDSQHFEVVSTLDNSIHVKVRTKNGKSAAVYALADLPLQHLARYRYARRLVACIRRHSVCVAVNSGTRRARLFADGRFEDCSAAGITRPGTARPSTDNARLRALCERLLCAAR
ncbi:hypothetical protein V1525DRAFT_342529 [Lipomyces kononenkoae]|uniref:Uncharacterized protein n=1 Tax=Lipomyces kononenkoae TaxID=34357 RepID=A0ACC3T2G1_LIPKO